MIRSVSKFIAPLFLALSFAGYMHLFVYAGEQAPLPLHHDAVTPDGGRYYGPLVDGKLHGKGIIVWANGARYEGEFKNGEFDGQGETTFKDGRKYKGAYANGLFQGKGRFESPDKTVYEGEFDKGEFTGQGTFLGHGGSRYTGGFKNWRFDGQGKFTNAKGDIYEGSFKEGQLHGKGVKISKNGSRYTGEFANWEFHGKGKLRDAEGGEYQGGFKYGYFDGQGTYAYAKPNAEGRTKDAGIWRYGSLEDKAAEEQTRKNVETALYNQRTLLDKAIAAVAPQNPKKIDLYLLAIGGDGSQEVFRREIEFVRKQFDRDFGTQGRSLALYNSRNTVADVPMATVTSIRESLAAIASRMDKENDILFLYLTSHGSKDHQFALNQNGLELPDLAAKELGKLLKESGIRWKLAVISACYSGGFINPIKDKYTMVMTAARHDRTSFGCADENDFTYFGKAYFHDALPKAASFSDAFDNARMLIQKREAEDFKASDGDKSAKDHHSEPQIHHSPLLEQHLKQWKAQLVSSQQNVGKSQPQSSLSRQ